MGVNCGRNVYFGTGSPQYDSPSRAEFTEGYGAYIMFSTFCRKI